MPVTFLEDEATIAPPKPGRNKITFLDEEEPVALPQEEPAQPLPETALNQLKRGFLDLAAKPAQFIANTQQAAIDLAGQAPVIGPAWKGALEMLPAPARAVAPFMQDIAERRAEMSPVDPRNKITSTVAGAVPQAIGMMATGGAAGVPAVLALGGMMGGQQGYETADEIGVTSPLGKMATAAAFAGAEAGIESMGGIGGKQVIGSIGKRLAHGITSETLEEPATGFLQDAVTRIAATDTGNGQTATGYDLSQLSPTDPRYWEKRGLETLGGAAGGAVFAGIQALGDMAQPQQAPVPQGEQTPDEIDAAMQEIANQQVEGQQVPGPVGTSVETGESVVPDLSNLEPPVQPPESVIPVVGSNQYEYAGLDAAGNEISGTIQANSQDEAVSAIRAAGNYPTSIKQAQAPLQRDAGLVEITNIDDIIANGGGTVQVSSGGRAVNYKQFGITVDGDTAEVAFVELDPSERGRGIGQEAYVALGNQLAKRGITLRSSKAQYRDGNRLWKKLADKGMARQIGQGAFEFIPPPSVQVAEQVEAIAPGAGQLGAEISQATLAAVDAANKLLQETEQPAPTETISEPAVVFPAAPTAAPAQEPSLPVAGAATPREASVIDSEYAEAFARGDVARQQELIDEAAKAAGRRELYHGSSTPYSREKVFENRETSSGADAMGIYMSPDAETSAGYGQTDRYWVEADLPGFDEFNRGLSLEDIAAGRTTPVQGDGSNAVWRNHNGTIEIVVRNAEQIGSASPVVFDKTGKPVPPSMRFPRKETITTSPSSQTRDYEPGSEDPKEIPPQTPEEQPSTEKRPGGDIRNMPQTFKPTPDQKWDWEVADDAGGTAFGNLKNGVADIIGMEASPTGKRYSEPEKYLRRGFFRQLVKTLQSQGAKTLKITMQSGDTRKALARLVETGELVNPRGVAGISVDEHPTTFDIPEPSKNDLTDEASRVKGGGMETQDLPYERAMEIEKEFGVDAADAHFFNVAINAVAANPEKWTSLAEGIQKEAIRAAVAGGGNLTRVGSLPIAKKIAEKYLQPKQISTTATPRSTGGPRLEATSKEDNVVITGLKRTGIGERGITAQGGGSVPPVVEQSPPTQRDASKPEQMSPMPGILPGGSKPVPMAPTAKYNEALGHLRKLLPNTSLRWMQEVHFQVAEGIDPAVAAKDAFAQASSHDAARQAVKAALDSKEIESGPQAQDLYAKVYDATYKPTTPQTPTPQPPQASAVQAAAETGVVEARSEEGGGERRNTFQPDDTVIMRSPYTDEDMNVSYRGPMGDDKAVVWTGKSQMSVPMEWLRHPNAPAPKKSYTPERVGPSPESANERIPQGSVSEVAPPTTPAGTEKPMPSTKDGLIEEIIGKKPEHWESLARWKGRHKGYSKQTKAELISIVESMREQEKRNNTITDATNAVFPSIKSVAQDAGNRWRTALIQEAKNYGIPDWVTMTDNALGEEAARLARRIAEKQTANGTKQPTPAPSAPSRESEAGAVATSPPGASPPVVAASDIVPDNGKKASRGTPTTEPATFAASGGTVGEAGITQPPSAGGESGSAKVSKVYLNVPFTSKESAKTLGAKWDADEKLWYVLRREDGSVPPVPDRWLMDEGVALRDKEVLKAARINAEQKYGKPVEIAPVEMVSGTAYALRFTGGDWLNSNVSKEEARATKAAQPEKTEPAKPDSSAAFEIIKNAYPFKTTQTPSEERSFLKKVKDRLKPLGIAGWKIDSAVESIKLRRAQSGGGKLFYVDPTALHAELLRNGDVARKPEAITQQEEPSKPPDTPRTIKQGDKVKFKQEGVLQSGTYQGVNADGTYSVQVKGEKVPRHVSARSLNENNESKVEGTKFAPVQETGPTETVVDKDIDSSLSDADKATAATELGFKSWNARTRDAFKKAYADWLVTAKAATTKLAEIFSKLAKATRALIIGGSIAISTQTTESHVVINDLPVRSVAAARAFPAKLTSPEMKMQAASLPPVAPIILPEQGETKPRIQATNRAKLDMRGTVAPAAVTKTAKWVVDTQDTKGRPFVIGDKTGGRVYVFDGSGKLVSSEAALFGMDRGDKVSTGKKITPSGRFDATIDPDASNEYDYGKTLDFYEKEASTVAIHRVYLALPEQNRPARIESESPADNRVSGGCVNVTDKMFDEVIDPLFSRAGGIVYILPETKAGAKSFSPLFALPTGNRAMPLDKARAHVYNKLKASPRKVRVINEPSLRFRGRYDPDGTITLNSAFLGSVEELNDVLLNHESIHDAIETEAKVRQQADSLLGALTEDELADIEAEILDYKDGEFSAEQVQAERQVEAIRKLTANRPDLQSAWGRLVESVSLSFKKLLGVNVSRQQAELTAARILARGLKRLRKGKTGGRTTGGGSLYQGGKPIHPKLLEKALAKGMAVDRGIGVDRELEILNRRLTRIKSDLSGNQDGRTNAYKQLRQDLFSTEEEIELLGIYKSTKGGTSSNFSISPSDVTRFKQLTASIPPKPTPEQLETWKQEHPAEYKELEAMRERVLREMGYKTNNGKGYWRGIDGENESLSLKGSYVTPQRSSAESYSVNVQKVYPKWTKLLKATSSEVLDAVPGVRSYGVEDWQTLDDQRNREAIWKEGYDAVSFEDVDPTGEIHGAYLLKNDGAIKSADPLATDDSGNLITPESWGDETSPDIRYASTNIQATGGEDSQPLSPSDNSLRAREIREAAAGINWGTATRSEKKAAVDAFGRKTLGRLRSGNAQPDATVVIASGEGQSAHARLDGIIDGKTLVVIQNGYGNSPNFATAEQAMAHAYDTSHEEMIHALQYIASVRRWKKAGSIGEAADFVRKESEDALSEIKAAFNEAKESGNTELASKIDSMVVDAWNLYNENHLPSLDAVMAEIEGGAGLSHQQFYSEVTRQLMQVSRNDFTTETGWQRFVTRVKAFLETVISRLKDALNLAKKGTLGPTIQQEINDLDAMMKDWETTNSKPLYSLPKKPPTGGDTYAPSQDPTGRTRQRRVLAGDLNPPTGTEVLGTVNPDGSMKDVLLDDNGKPVYVATSGIYDKETAERIIEASVPLIESIGLETVADILLNPQRLLDNGIVPNSALHQGVAMEAQFQANQRYLKDPKNPANQSLYDKTHNARERVGTEGGQSQGIRGALIGNERYQSMFITEALYDQIKKGLVRGFDTIMDAQEIATKIQEAVKRAEEAARSDLEDMLGAMNPEVPNTVDPPVTIETPPEMDKAEKKANSTAEGIITEAANRLGDPPVETEKQVNLVRELYRRHVENRMGKQEFEKEAVALRLNPAVAYRLWNTGNTERTARETITRYKQIEAEKRKDEAADKKARRLIYETMKRMRQSGYNEANKKQADSIIKAFNDQVKKPDSLAKFQARLKNLRVSGEAAEALFETAKKEAADRAKMQVFKDRKALLEKDSPVLASLLNRLKGDVSWKEILGDPKLKMRERMAGIFERVRKHEALQDLSPAEQQQLTVELERLLQKQRLKQVNKDLQAAGLNLPKKAEKAVRDSMPELLRLINLGTFSAETFRDAIAPKFGLKTLSSKEVKRVEEIAKQLHDAPEGLPKDKLKQELVMTMSDITGVPRGEVALNVWVGSVLSGFATQFDTAASALNGLRTIIEGTGVATAKGEGKLAREAWKRYFEVMPRAFREALNHIMTGDRSMMNGMSAEADALFSQGSKFGHPFPVAEKAWRSAKEKGESWKLPFLATPLAVGRLMSAADHFNSRSVSHAMLPLAMAFNKRIYQDLHLPDAADKANAVKQAEAYLGKPKSYKERLEFDRYVDQLMDASVSESDKIRDDILNQARWAGQRSSYTEDPTGIGGSVWQLLKKSEQYLEGKGIKLGEDAKNEKAAGKKAVMNMVAFLSRFSGAIIGTKFARFTGNRVNEMISLTPGIGLVRKWEKANNPTREAMVYGDQAAGSIVALAAIAAFLSWLWDDEDDKDKWLSIEGSWSGLDNKKTNQLRSDGKEPYSIGIKRQDGSTINIKFSQWPFAALLATIGGIEDKRRYRPEAWSKDTILTHAASAVTSGGMSMMDLSSISALTENLGKTRVGEDPVTDVQKRLNKTFANFMGGFIPRWAKDLDLLADPKHNKASDFYEYWTKEIPVYRRGVGRPMLDIFGQQVELKRTPWRRAVTNPKLGPEYVLAGKLAERGIFLPAVDPTARSVGKGKRRRELTEDEQDTFVRTAGSLYRDVIIRYGEKMLDMPEQDAVDLLNEKLGDARDKAEKQAVR